jgi:heterodisulfide reductase subunit B
MSDKKSKYKEVAYYPGCALEGSGHAYNRSTKALGKALGLKLKEVERTSTRSCRPICPPGSCRLPPTR